MELPQTLDKAPSRMIQIVQKPLWIDCGLQMKRAEWMQMGVSGCQDSSGRCAARMPRRLQSKVQLLANLPRNQQDREERNFR